MKKAVWSAMTAVLVWAAPANAQTVLQTQALNATVIVGNQARLTVGGGPITFADSDPDTVTSIPASSSVTIDARARVAPSTTLNVTVVASGDYFDPSTSTVPVSALTWTVSGAPFIGGTMSTTAQNLASWTGSAAQSGTQSYVLANSWSYAPGTYTLTLTYTLSTP